jgi:hypothetical protein
MEMTTERPLPTRAKDALLQQAEDDVTRLRQVLRTTKAEVARSKDIVERLEQRAQAKKPAH